MGSQYSGHEGPLLFAALPQWLDRRVSGSGDPNNGHTGSDFFDYRPPLSGTVPPGISQLKSPTAIVWLLGRIYCTGTPEDYAAVHSLQDRFKLQPLSTWGKDYTPPTGKVDPSIDMKTAVRDQVNRLSTAEYFTLLADLSPPVTKAG